MFTRQKLSFVFLTFFLALTGSAKAALMTKGSTALGWNGCPYIRYWINPKMAIESGVNLILNTSNAPGAVNTNTLFLSGRGLKLLFEKKDFNINVGAGIDITAVSNALGTEGCSQTTFNFYGLVDLEYFLKSIPNLSFGSVISFGYTSNTLKQAGSSVKTTNVGFLSNGFTLNALSIRYYFK